MHPVVGLDRDELTKIWGDRVFGDLSSRARAAYRSGRWASAEGATAVFVPDPSTPMAIAEERRVEVEQALATHLGGRVQVRLEAEVAAPAPRAAPVETPDDEVPVSAAEFAELEAAPDAPASAEARLLDAFPGTEEVSG
jgi:hypothetical protein